MAAPRYLNGPALAAQQPDIEKIESMAGHHPGLPIDPNVQANLAQLVTNALAGGNPLAAVQGIVKGLGNQLEVVEDDPAQARLNLQLALNRLTSDTATQTMARLYGKEFQKLYNLTNDQMLTLCRLAVDVGAYKNTADLNQYMDLFAALPPAIKSLSPGALDKLGLQSLGIDGLIGSCSCCCP